MSSTISVSTRVSHIWVEVVKKMTQIQEKKQHNKTLGGVTNSLGAQVHLSNTPYRSTPGFVPQVRVNPAVP